VQGNPVGFVDPWGYALLNPSPKPETPASTLTEIITYQFVLDQLLWHALKMGVINVYNSISKQNCAPPGGSSSDAVYSGAGAAEASGGGRKGGGGNDGDDGDDEDGNPKERSPYPPAKRFRFPSRKEAYEAVKRAGKGKEPTYHRRLTNKLQFISRRYV
jgi:hypothetical protein